MTELDAPGGATLREGSPASESSSKTGLLRRLYDWVLHWAETPHGLTALVLLTAAESSFFPIPPDPLLMALCLGARKKSLRLAAWTTGASLAGAIVGYAIGFGFWEIFRAPFFAYVPGVTPETFEQVRLLYDHYDFGAIFLAGLTPIPYKVFTLSAGVFSINFGVFVVASILSRGMRFFLVAGLIYRFGAPISEFIDRYFNLLTIVFGVLLVGGFIVVKLVL